VSKKVKAAEELPLDSPHWRSREKTVAYCRAHGGEIAVADVALTATVNQGGLPVRIEWFDHQTNPPTRHRKLLLAKDYEFGPYISSNLLVVQPRRPDVPVLPRPHALSFWGPKLTQIWPAEAAEPVSTEQRAADLLEPPRRRRGPVLTHDWFSICGEIARRCVDPKTGRAQVPKNESRLAKDVLAWCQEQGWDEPAVSEMREAVKRVCAALRTVQK
jgi:hypothetical protein